MDCANGANKGNLSPRKEGIIAIKAKPVDAGQYECANSTKQSINRYITNREDFISVRIVQTALVVHTARMGRLEMLLCVATKTWSAHTT